MKTSCSACEKAGCVCGAFARLCVGGTFSQQRLAYTMAGEGEASGDGAPAALGARGRDGANGSTTTADAVADTALEPKEEASILHAQYDGGLKKFLEMKRVRLQAALGGRKLFAAEVAAMNNAIHTGTLEDQGFGGLANAVRAVLNERSPSAIIDEECCQMCGTNTQGRWVRCDDEGTCKCAFRGWRHQRCAGHDRWGPPVGCIDESSTTLSATPINLRESAFSLAAAGALNEAIGLRNDRASVAENTFVVRMVHDKRHEYAPGKMAAQHLSTKAQKIECTRKCFVVFQMLRGAWTMVFVFFAQEYDDTCAHAPNRGICSLEYVDSFPHIAVANGVKARTLWVEVLARYFDDAAQRGLTEGYIWACAPIVDGEAYILPSARAFSTSRSFEKRQTSLGKFYDLVVKRTAEIGAPRAAAPSTSLHAALGPLMEESCGPGSRPEHVLMTGTRAEDRSPQSCPALDLGALTSVPTRSPVLRSAHTRDLAQQNAEQVSFCLPLHYTRILLTV